MYLLSKLKEESQLIHDLLVGLTSASQPKIFLVGLPRTGTTWIASILNTADGIKYVNEPFNYQNIPETEPHFMQYLLAEDQDTEFERHCRNAFANHLTHPFVTFSLSSTYKRFGWFPGRVMVKDVHSFLALEWIARNISPTIVIIMRHPCAVAASWFRIGGKNEKAIGQLLAQPRLFSDYLQPFEHVLNNAQTFWQKMGAYWGASYYVMLQQQLRYPDWILVKHEDFCFEPVQESKKLFAQLNLTWTTKTDQVLSQSTRQHSGKPYQPQRVSSQEPDKWKSQLTPQQIEQVRQFVQPFGIPYYSDL
ncbi:MAG: sulfotransferase [Coleofasciculaceae cyanobacterium]